MPRNVLKYIPLTHKVDDATVELDVARTSSRGGRCRRAAPAPNLAPTAAATLTPRRRKAASACTHCQPIIGARGYFLFSLRERVIVRDLVYGEADAAQLSKLKQAGCRRKAPEPASAGGAALVPGWVVGVAEPEAGRLSRRARGEAARWGPAKVPRARLPREGRTGPPAPPRRATVFEFKPFSS